MRQNRLRFDELAHLSAAVSRIQTKIDKLAWGGPAESAKSDDGSDIAETGDDPGFSGARLAKALQLKTHKDMRERLLAPKLSLIGDPVWSLLLELYIAHYGRRLIGLSDASRLMGVPPTTALRHIGYCESRGMIEREPDAFDRRRVFIRLSQSGFDLMSVYLDRL